MNPEPIQAETRQLTTCFTLALYNGLVGIETNKPQFPIQDAVVVKTCSRKVHWATKSHG